ncbi:MAG: hypothetical protein KME32_01495 [Mojavia pulchra JT2-VF2]|jgi:hypothetical protein|uniref:Uncharacterized protein n=1 Tax=Mojavia pulchra JT2-VF2 TaxID=287848 RepID=A0A951PTZ3_9NOST|nr:hypothetical protein [Mojavia pulchra JT2-VF2]
MQHEQKNIAKSLIIAESLIEELSDEQLAACIGGCSLTINAGQTTGIEVPLIKLPISVQPSVDTGIASVNADTDGSQRFGYYRK